MIRRRFGNPFGSLLGLTLSVCSVSSLWAQGSQGAGGAVIQAAPSSTWMIDAGLFVVLAAAAVFAVCRSSQRG